MDEEKARAWERYSTFLVEAEGRLPVCEMKKVVNFYDTLTDEEQARFDNEVAQRCEARLRMLYSRKSKRRPTIESDVGMPDYDDARGDDDDDYSDEDDEFLTDFEKSLRISRAMRHAEAQIQCCRPLLPLPVPPSPPSLPSPLQVSMEEAEASTYRSDCVDGSGNPEKRGKPKKPKRKSKLRV